MALLQFVQRNYSLPDPKGSLSSKVSAAAIAGQTHEAQAELQSYTGREGMNTTATSSEQDQMSCD